MTDIQPIDDERVSAYLDGELTEEERGEFEALLRQRADYALVVEQLQTMRTAIKALPRHTLPADFAEGVLRRAEREMLIGSNAQQATVSRTAGQRSLWIVAAGLAACLLAMIVWPRLRENGQPLVAQAENETENRRLLENLDRRAPLAGAAAGRAGTVPEEKIAASPNSRTLQSRGAASVPASPTAPLGARPVDPQPTATAESAVAGSTDDGMQLEDADRQLANPADTLKLKAESLAEQLDVIVVTQLRAPEDWQQLNLALTANRFELVTESPPSLGAVLTPAQSNIDRETQVLNFDAELFNQQLLRKLHASTRVLDQEPAEKTGNRGQAAAAAEDTYVLYVEGSAEQWTGLVRQLRDANAARRVLIEPAGAMAAFTDETQPAARNSARADVVRRESADDSAAVNPTTPGRVANLGRSTLDDALSPTFRDRAKQVSSAFQQMSVTRSPKTVDGPDFSRLQGLILVQDVGEIISSKVPSAPLPAAPSNDSDPAKPPQDEG